MKMCRALCSTTINCRLIAFEVATIVGTATNQGHAFDATHGGLIDGNDLDGTPNGACSSSVRYPNFDCNLGVQSLSEVGSLNCISSISELEGVRLSRGGIHTSKQKFNFYFR